MNDDNLQKAIYAKLSADTALMSAIKGIYADVEQPSDAGSNDPFPYVTIGNDNHAPWDSKTFFGTQAICQIDVWSRKNNFLEVKQIGSMIREALHHQSLTIQDADHTMTVHQSSVYTKDPDGQTKRGMLMFNVRFTHT